jgi:hypothetical protein
MWDKRGRGDRVPGVGFVNLHERLLFVPASQADVHRDQRPEAVGLRFGFYLRTSVVLLVDLIRMAGMIAPVSPVHEHVKERAKQQQRVRPDAKQVREMLGDEKECADRKKGQEHDASSRAKPVRMRPSLIW